MSVQRKRVQWSIEIELLDDLEQLADPLHLSMRETVEGLLDAASRPGAFNTVRLGLARRAGQTVLCMDCAWGTTRQAQMITADATGDELLVQWRLGGPEPPYEVIARCPKCAGSHLEEVFP